MWTCSPSPSILSTPSTGLRSKIRHPCLWRPRWQRSGGPGWTHLPLRSGPRVLQSTSATKRLPAHTGTCFQTPSCKAFLGDPTHMPLVVNTQNLLLHLGQRLVVSTVGMSCEYNLLAVVIWQPQAAYAEFRPVQGPWSNVGSCLQPSKLDPGLICVEHAQVPLHQIQKEDRETRQTGCLTICSI